MFYSLNHSKVLEKCFIGISIIEIMKIKDWNIFCDTIGKQLNFVLSSAILATINFLISDYLERIGLCVLFSLVVKGTMLVLAIYYFIYTIILTKKIIEKQYK